MTIIQAILLAILEGITEFLPVSSTGHMILAASLMKIPSTDFVKLYIVAIQLGAIISVLALYWKRFFGPAGMASIRQLFHSLFHGKLPRHNFYWKLLVAFIPAVVFGILFKKQIDKLLESPLIVGISLLIGGVVFILLDDWFRRSEKTGDDEVKSDFTALKIGCFQVLAMIPGVSRSAATIIGGIVSKLNKRAAAEFSFFLAVPTMFGATAKDLWDFHKKGLELTHHEIFLLLAGNAVAFIVAMIAIKGFIDYLSRHGFKLFGYYRIVVGLIVIALIMMHFGFVNT